MCSLNGWLIGSSSRPKKTYKSRPRWKNKRTMKERTTMKRKRREYKNKKTVISRKTSRNLSIKKDDSPSSILYKTIINFMHTFMIINKYQYR
jgi:hypothetical protein